MKEIEKIFGVILQNSIEQNRPILKALKPEWFGHGKEKQVYDAIMDLAHTGEEINLLTLTLHLRKLYPNNKNLMLYLSQCSNDTNYRDFSTIDQIMTSIRIHYLFENARKTSSDLSALTSGIDIDMDKYVEILENGIEKFRNEIENQEKNMTDIMLEVIKRHDRAKNGDLGGITLGYPIMDKNIILEPVDMMVVGARPGMGKTSFGVALLCQTGFIEGRKVAYFNLEMSNTQLMRRIFSNLTDIDSNRIKLGKCTIDEMQMINDFASHPNMKNLTLFEGTHTLQQIRMKVLELKYNNQCDLIIIDYLQKIATPGQKRYDQVTAASNGVKLISQNLGIPVVALAQLGRDAGKSKSRPILPDLRESGEIEQDASVVAFLHRPEYYGEEYDENGHSLEGFAEFIVAKNREGDCPIIEFTCDLATSRWKEGFNRQNRLVTPGFTPPSHWHDDNPF